MLGFKSIADLALELVRRYHFNSPMATPLPVPGDGMNWHGHKLVGLLV